MEASVPMRQEISAGRHWRSGMSEGNSFHGARAADWAAER